MFSRIFVFCFVGLGVRACGDFFWREYDGMIPSDAISAGRASNGEKLYIGHGYVHDYGIMSGTIHPGKMEITVSCYGPKTLDSMISILCADDIRKYYWLSVNSTSYPTQIEGKCHVLSGWNQSAAGEYNLTTVPLLIGRSHQFSDYIVGDVAQLNSAEAFLHVPHEGTEYSVTEYEVLIQNAVPLANYDSLSGALAASN